jgi:aspartate aminotransferase
MLFAKLAWLIVMPIAGTGSLRVGAAFIEKWLPGKTVYLSSPTWGNHKNIFGDAGVEWKEYRYFDKKTTGLDFEGMVEDIKVRCPCTAVKKLRIVRLGFGTS